MKNPPPAPVPEGSEDRRGPPGQAHKLVAREVVAAAFRGTSSSKGSPGSGGVGPPAIRCFYGRDPPYSARASPQGVEWLPSRSQARTTSPVPSHLPPQLLMQDRDYLWEASLAHLTRKARRPGPIKSGGEYVDMPRLSDDTAPPPGERQGLQGSPEGREGNCQQVRPRSDRPLPRSGYVAIGPYLAEKSKTIRSDKCWWYGSGERQPHHHLVVKCQAWFCADQGPVEERRESVRNARGRRLSGYSSGTSAQPRRSWPSFGRRRSGGW